MALHFWKMHGAGNHFVVLDAIDAPIGLESAQLRRLADPALGVGFDQLLVIVRDPLAAAGLGYRIFNADASPAGQCGNGARCVFAWLLRHRGLQLPLQLMSPAGLVQGSVGPDGGIQVDLGVPQFTLAELPLRLEPGLAQRLDDGRIALRIDGADCVGTAVSMGNPHFVVRVAELDNAAVASLGAALNAHAAWPDGVNVSFVQVLAAGHLRLRVYERGVGETLACGSGACATAATAIRAGWLPGPEVRLTVPGGTLDVYWRGAGEPIALAGPVCHVFDGVLVDGWDR